MWELVAVVSWSRRGCIYTWGRPALGGLDWLNSLRRSGALRSWALTHDRSEAGYPFQWTRYSRFLARPLRFTSMISSISYYSSSSSRSGGGLGKAGP